MTKFILAGGYVSKGEDGGEEFVRECVAGFDEPVRVLICTFARPEDEWQKTFENSTMLFTTKLRNLKVLTTLAKPDEFIAQLRTTDVVYFHGGRTKALMRALEGTGWEHEIDGKTIAGSSAGMNFLARYYYSLDDLEVCEGLGLLPIKALVHYESSYNAPNIDWEAAYEELQNHDDDLPIYAVPEGAYEVVDESDF